MNIKELFRLGAKFIKQQQHNNLNKDNSKIVRIWNTLLAQLEYFLVDYQSAGLLETLKQSLSLGGVIQTLLKLSQT